LRERAQGIGKAIHGLGAVVVLLALAWGAWLLRLQLAACRGGERHDR
jgi:hypothetical protein